MEKVMESHGILTGHKCTNPVKSVQQFIKAEGKGGLCANFTSWGSLLLAKISIKKQTLGAILKEHRPENWLS